VLVYGWNDTLIQGPCPAGPTGFQLTKLIINYLMKSA
jgi:hypothetical protein